MKFTLLLSIALVILVIFLFLRDIAATLIPSVAFPIGGQQTNSQYQFTLQSLNLADLRQAIPILLEKVKALPGLRDVDSDLQLRTPQIQVKVDQNKAAALNITAAQVQKTLSNAYSGGQVSIIYTPNNQYTVVMELLPEYQRDAKALSVLYIRSNSSDTNSKPIPLSAIASIEQTVGPLTVNHLSGLPSATISFDSLPGTSLSDGIMLVDFAIERQRNANKTPLEAIHEACIVRFRPIMMLFFIPTWKHGVKKCTSKTTLNFHHKTTKKINFPSRFPEPPK
ncbi:MAG: efflux RND transporter permease subunit [Cyanobacteria bacterium]|nr:efflux RND transporter permease subunit [Cyanobacteriota bacterium]